MKNQRIREKEVFLLKHHWLNNSQIHYIEVLLALQVITTNITDSNYLYPYL
jgi:hypothetical protein